MKAYFNIYFLLCSFFTISQNDIRIGYFYELNKEITALDLTSENNAEAIETLESSQITIQDFINSPYKINTKGIKVTLPNKTLFKILSIDNNGQFYLIKVYNNSNFDNQTLGITRFQIINYARLYDGDKPKWSFVSTAVTIPIKIRPGDGKRGENKKRYFDFEGNVNVGLTAGIRRRISNNGTSYLNLFGGISVGSTKITPNNSDLESETNASTLSPFIGLMFEYNNFEIGAFTGWDHVSGKVGESWHYNALPWIGIGLGYNIFTTKNTPTTND